MKTHQEQIDEAAEIARGLLHGHLENELTKGHLERALSHLREAWIAEDGQQARGVDELAEANRQARAFFARLQTVAQAREEEKIAPPSPSR